MNSQVDISNKVQPDSDLSKISVFLFLGIVSAPIRIDRRRAVRETWWKKCQENEEVACFFVTDAQDNKGLPLLNDVLAPLHQENSKHNDLIFAESPSGRNLGRRILWLFQWVNERYDFKYILKLDDDYFICFDKLMVELKYYRPRKFLVWGELHCRRRGQAVFDEAFLIVTPDVVQYIVDRKNTSLMCHPWGGQSLGYWLNDFKQ
ncbi:beta-1,3-galactosyltransferase 6-like isoform X3 [Xenia sp. Carnegie-2017]|nr:beta-1,3-galactosyltransferase 6-like isoform X2 [Xenia sp. Carnegie-2017]XP_046863716.1 beta-1,3-galactosyltransferase 6-like isoform X3 [Xenia sp. Carnegie-2017]